MLLPAKSLWHFCLSTYQVKKSSKSNLCDPAIKEIGQIRAFYVLHKYKFDIFTNIVKMWRLAYMIYILDLQL